MGPLPSGNPTWHRKCPMNVELLWEKHRTYWQGICEGVLANRMPGVDDDIDGAQQLHGIPKTKRVYKDMYMSLFQNLKNHKPKFPKLMKIHCAISSPIIQ